MQQDGTTIKYNMWSEAIMAIFQNGVRIGSENIILIPIADEILASQRRTSQNLLLNQKCPSVLCFSPHETQELVVQYKMRSHHVNELPCLDYLDLGTFFCSDQHCVWSFREDNKFNNVFGRQLEHILCICLVKVVTSSKNRPRILFDTTLTSGSITVGDL